MIKKKVRRLLDLQGRAILGVMQPFMFTHTDGWYWYFDKWHIYYIFEW